MSPPDLNNLKYVLAPGYRLQFEEAQDQFVLLYPEGMVELSETAADVLQHCREPQSPSVIVGKVSDAYEGADIGDDVREFLEVAHARGWLVTH